MATEHRNRKAISSPAREGTADDRADRRRRCAAHFMAAYKLTAAEAAIAAALADGARARDIAESRGVSLNTLRAQRRNAYAKLCVGDQIELVHALPRLWPEA